MWELLINELCYSDAKPESTEEDLLTPPWGPDPPHPPPPATSWTESLNRMQTLPAPRHKEGSVRIRYTVHTMWGVPSLVIFCYLFLSELRGPAWAVGSYSIGPPARGIFQNTFNKISGVIGHPRVPAIGGMCNSRKT